MNTEADTFAARRLEYSPAANASALRIHCILKVARSEPSVDCGWPSYNSYVFLAYKRVHIFTGIHHHPLSYNPEHSYDSTLPSHINNNNNDLVCPLCCRHSLRSGCPCPSSGRQSFYPSHVEYHVVVFVDGHEQLLVDSEFVQLDGIYPSVHLISVPK